MRVTVRWCAAGPIGSVLRYLVVDHLQVHALGAADEAGDDVDDDGEHVHDAQVEERGRVVDAVEVIGDPLVEAEGQEESEGCGGHRDQGNTQDVVAGYGRGVVDLGLAPRQDRRRYRGTEERPRGAERG